MRLVAAFIVTAIIGVPIGLLMGTSNAAREVIDPWIELYRPVPSLAYIGLMVLWLGLGDLSRITLLVLAGLPPTAIGTMEAVQSVLPERINGARSLGIKGLDIFRTVIFPSSLPGIITSLRIASSGIFTTLIAAEMIGANVGIGSMVLTASYNMQLGIVIVGVIAMGLMGVVVDQVFRWYQHRFIRWAGRF
jgi:taurine transport system permease protein